MLDGEYSIMDIFAWIYCIPAKLTGMYFAAIMKLIGLGGISGSGKTHLLRHLQNEMKDDISVLSFDNYYRPIEFQEKDENGFENFDLPQGLDIDKFLKDIERLKQGQSVKLKVYQFNKPEAEEIYIDIKPSPILLIEGIFVFHFPSVFTQLDYKIFIAASHETTLRRRLNRDTSERGIQETFVHYQWKNHALPGYEKYLLPYKHMADTIIDNEKNDEQALVAMGIVLRQLIKKKHG